MKKAKPVRKVCKCGWSGKTKANICPLPLCRSPLSMHREKNGQQQRVDEKVEPTPEQIKRRKAGLYELTIDALVARGVVSDTQEEAYRKFCNAREVLYGDINPSISGYGRQRGGSDGPPDKVLITAKAVHDLGLDALDCAGIKPKVALLDLYYGNEVLSVEYLLIGMDALVSAYRNGDRAAKNAVDTVTA
jgi:hypothetical protein